jgi:hypothetical protein
MPSAKEKFSAAPFGMAAPSAASSFVYAVLFSAFYRLRSTPGVSTPIDLGGDWKMELYNSRSHLVPGRATIRQQAHDPVIEISGEMNGHSMDTTFTSLFGVIRGRNVYLFYENREGERGIIQGPVTDDRPRSLRLTYCDLVGYDRNNDPSGVIVLNATRRTTLAAL